MSDNKLCLGSVQFGLNYGINNKLGKPSKTQVFHMLDIAVQKGIEYFDTAAAYGDAEEILGEYFVSKDLQKSVKIISKLMPNLIEKGCKDAEIIVKREINRSLKRLGVDSLEGYLLHTPTDFYNTDVMSGLSQAKNEGLIKNLGVSIYETQHALDVVNSGIVDYIQIPYNVFDQRLEITGFFKAAKDNQVKVFARSPFLQGLIFMQREEIPGYLHRAENYLREFDRIISKYDMSRVEAALLLSYENPGIDYVVFGVDSFEQLLQDIEVLNRSRDFSECMTELREHFINIEKEIIFPSLWAKR